MIKHLPAARKVKDLTIKVLYILVVIDNVYITSFSFEFQKPKAASM